ncbi:hypothetical protein SGLAM104S_07040 [Streptomyces glaucescens]
MPDRSLRLLTLTPQSVQGGQRSGVLLRERPTSPPDAPSGSPDGGGRGSAGQEDNPFAPPPEGTPDRPWQPRGRPTAGARAGRTRAAAVQAWGSQWSDRQPGRSPGGFGERPGPGPGRRAPATSGRLSPVHSHEGRSAPSAVYSTTAAPTPR